MPIVTRERENINPKIRRFVTTPRRMLIDGKWVDPKSGADNTFHVYNPATGEVMVTVAAGDHVDVDLAVKAARRALEQGPWSRMTHGQRGKLLWKLADLMEENLEEFAQIESLDNGKPLAVARVADIPLAIDNFRYMSGWTTKIGGQTIPLSNLDQEYFAYTLCEPVGVVGQIIPWDFPLLMAAWKLGPALAAGCTVVLKPAEQTPLSALRLGELFEEAGFPPGVVNIVTGYGETAGAAIAAHPDIDKVAFTGSTEVGKLIVHAAAGNLKKVSLELGGKSPNIVFADADLENAIHGATSAIFFNHGQCCCAGSRLYIEQKIFDEVVEGVSENARNYKVTEGFDPHCDMGPLVSDEQLDRVLGFIEAGEREGAKTVIGGHRLGDRGYFVEPTLLTNVRPGMKVIDEEIFGPVVCAMPFEKLDEVAAQMNNSPYGLAGAIWTQDLSKAHRMAKAMNAGTVWINCYNVFDAALPFGGYKQSGWGREMGREVFELYTRAKSVCLKISNDAASVKELYSAENEISEMAVDKTAEGIRKFSADLKPNPPGGRLMSMHQLAKFIEAHRGELIHIWKEDLRNTAARAQSILGALSKEIEERQDLLSFLHRSFTSDGTEFEDYLDPLINKVRTRTYSISDLYSEVVSLGNSFDSVSTRGFFFPTVGFSHVEITSMVRARLSRIFQIVLEQTVAVYEQAFQVGRLARLEDFKKLFQEVALQTHTPLALVATWLRHLKGIRENETTADFITQIFGQLKKLEIAYDRLALLSVNSDRLPGASQKQLLDLGVEMKRTIEEFPISEASRIAFNDPGDLPYLPCEPAQISFIFGTILSYLVRFSSPVITVRIGHVENTIGVMLSGSFPAPFDTSDELLARTRFEMALGEPAIRAFAENNSGKYQRLETPAGEVQFRVDFAMHVQGSAGS